MARALLASAPALQHLVLGSLFPVPPAATVTPGLHVLGHSVQTRWILTGLAEFRNWGNTECRCLEKGC